MLINVFFIIFLFFMKYILKFIPLKFIPKDYLVRGVKRTRSVSGKTGEIKSKIDIKKRPSIS